MTNSPVSYRLLRTGGSLLSLLQNSPANLSTHCDDSLVTLSTTVSFPDSATSKISNLNLTWLLINTQLLLSFLFLSFLLSFFLFFFLYLFISLFIYLFPSFFPSFLLSFFLSSFPYFLLSFFPAFFLSLFIYLFPYFLLSFFLSFFISLFRSFFLSLFLSLLLSFRLSFFLSYILIPNLAKIRVQHGIKRLCLFGLYISSGRLSLYCFNTVYPSSYLILPLVVFLPRSCLLSGSFSSHSPSFTFPYSHLFSASSVLSSSSLFFLLSITKFFSNRIVLFSLPFISLSLSLSLPPEASLYLSICPLEVSLVLCFFLRLLIFLSSCTIMFCLFFAASFPSRNFPPSQST
ncbi:unnamed protein product [Acanthosepion pharaonis]|uniref:Uncharacterized protein n=1 Tax=Acanthosepion pharaonis TaxID=158019 RepID=A0A812C4H4_ACAPH|nr:unnamed protein product [Sepia pharaonis]